jgi:hypothetical protein
MRLEGARSRRKCIVIAGEATQSHARDRSGAKRRLITTKRRPGTVASIFALIVAAGRGARFGGLLPKQYLALGGTTVLRHAALAFATHPRIAGVLVAIRP